MTDGTPATLRVEESADRVVVTLDRPERRNAIDQRMVDELHEVCAALERDPRLLILTGAGGVFASGADIAELRERTAADARRGINATVFTRIAELPLPVIAAIDGPALGGGAELAYAADFRIGTPRLRIGNPETGLGIIAAAGALWRLPRLIGEPLAKELTLAGRILTGEEALAVHLVTALYEPEELLAGAHALADRIATNDPLATQLTKSVLHAAPHEHPHAEQEAQAVLFESPEKKRRMTEFLERRRR
ncbi:enoyl-CoA hydratase/isomerase family protein [Leifsonia sp. F6_8S_P_1B]|uniref:Enoyl-CoA hydratase/isomerase family protein n=1 Tax=Leifsonia williamsii TaxID=3035919 RepID=A0ABT8KEZ9_9MICO|nr:enoyl-CoA hydratase/isomerase family protein [Leifsonia williamsii]MDN4615999.1 enoyl-CoA hydratase/isomerase family protein [Leifsonia williamsii]